MSTLKPGERPYNLAESKAYSTGWDDALDTIRAELGGDSKDEVWKTPEGIASLVAGIAKAKIMGFGLMGSGS